MRTPMLQHWVFAYPQPVALQTETHIPKYNLYNAKRSRTNNRRAFRRFLASLEALHQDVHTYTTIEVQNDVDCCYVCNKTSDDMIWMYHRKGYTPFLAFGTAPPKEELDELSDMRGIYLRVNSDGSRSRDDIPICPACSSQRKEMQYDWQCPESCLALWKADCARAERIIMRHWQRGDSWVSCKNIFPPRRPGVSLF